MVKNPKKIMVKNEEVKIAVLQEQMIQMNKNFVLMQGDVKEIKDKIDNNYARKSDLTQWENDSAAVHTDHEGRLRRLEIWGAILVGVSYALQFYFQFLRHL